MTRPEKIRGNPSPTIRRVRSSVRSCTRAGIIARSLSSFIFFPGVLSSSRTVGEVPGQKAYRRRSREGRRNDPHAFHLPLVVIPFHRPGSIHQRGARRKEEQEIHRTTITTRAQCGTWGRCVGCVCTKGVGEKHMRVVGTPTPPPPIAMGQYGRPGELGVKQSARRKRLPLQEQVL